MGKKSRAKQSRQKDESQVYMQRLQANLEYFRKNRPAIYEMLANMQLQRAELVVTPGKDDVDLTVNGKSCYRGLAREYSVGEAAKVLVENPENKRLLTFAPPPAEKYKQASFAEWLLARTIRQSPTEDRPFHGYLRGNFFPSMVFLGCGLGYHIDELSKRADIVNGIIIEREPEKFAVSLYTVDWATICDRFSRRGRSLSFALGRADTEDQIRSLVHRHMARDLPFYPFFSIYYNHLADVELAKGVFAASKDLSVVTSNWSDYDSELIRLSNTAYNLDNDFRYLDASRLTGRQGAPLVVVGSGPSLDNRLDALREVRDKVVIASAGTGLGPLLAAGIEPDFHVELDPSYLVYHFLSELPDGQRRRIPLLAVNEVNPHIAGLFDKVIYFFKTDNTIPNLLGVEDAGFSGCNPTVTNSALALGHRLGFETVYLFGTDYGFASIDNDHSHDSIYGQEVQGEALIQFRKKVEEKNRGRKVFATPSVNGGTVNTIAEYYSAKRSVEDLLANLKSVNARLAVYNCSDGAAIEGAQWLSREAFVADIENQPVVGSMLPDLEVSSTDLDGGGLEQNLTAIHDELKRLCNQYRQVLKGARLRGRKDLCEVINELRQLAGVVRELKPGAGVSSAQLFGHQLLKGTLDHFLYVGLTHGMACEGDEAVSFASVWRDNFQLMLDHVPAHFKIVMLSERSLEGDWSRRSLKWRDPMFRAFEAEHSA